MTTQSPKYFYTTDSWDEAAWLDIVSIEYESLVAAYPFDAILRQITDSSQLKVLDVGCGSALFPRYLQPNLADGIHISCDLLDVSERSLHQSRGILSELEHFDAGRSIKAFIEDIPSAVPRPKGFYDAIWAIHSFTTVDIERMPAVFRHLLDLLSDDGLLLIYQLTGESAYQTLHETYRKRVADPVPPFMQFEDTERILRSLPAEYEVVELEFDHVLPKNRPDLVEHYLRKCVLDESVDTVSTFGDLLPRFESGNTYRIPQFINLVSISKS